MRIKATLLQRTMFYDCVVAMLVAFVVVKSFESFKAIMHKFEQHAARLEALRDEKDGATEAMRAQNEAKIDTLRAENEGKIEAMRAEKDALRVENHKLEMDAKDVRYDALLITTGRDARERAAARAAGPRAFSPAPRRASAFVAAASAARASDEDSD